MGKRLKKEEEQVAQVQIVFPGCDRTNPHLNSHNIAQLEV